MGVGPNFEAPPPSLLTLLDVRGPTWHVGHGHPWDMATRGTVNTGSIPLFYSPKASHLPGAGTEGRSPRDTRVEGQSVHVHCSRLPGRNRCAVGTGKAIQGGLPEEQH